MTKCSMQKRIESLSKKKNESINGLNSLIDRMATEAIQEARKNWGDKNSFIRSLNEFVAKNYVDLYKDEILYEVESELCKRVRTLVDPIDDQSWFK